jgi:putative DNA primase/helicase
MRSIRFLDRPLWQRDAFQLVIGRKGVGKGTYLAGQAARVTRGELYDRPMNVLVLASEDSDEIDLKPRIVAAGGDPERIFSLDETMLLPRDVQKLRAAALETGDVGIIILDPIASYVRGDTHAEDPVRDAIDPLNDLANELECLLLGVRHLSEKDATKGALAATLGASAWVQVPRAVVAVVADDEQDLVFHIAVVAGNRSARGAGRTFRIDLVDVEGLDEPITRAIETGVSAKSVDDLLGDGEKRQRKAPKRDSAREVILRELEVEPQPLDYLKAKCAAEGVESGDTVWRAANQLKSEGLVDRANSGPGTPWLWSLTSARARGGTTNTEVLTSVPESVTSVLQDSPGEMSNSAPPYDVDEVADIVDAEVDTEPTFLEDVV